MRSLLFSLILALSLPAWGASLTRTSAFEYDPATGLLTKETIEPDQPQLRVDTTYAYDARGNRTAATVSSPATGSAAIVSRTTTTTTYDADGQFPLTTTNAVGHSETKVFDPAQGTLTSLTGPNGLTTSWEYDGFGRKTRETRSDGSVTQWTYDVCDAACPANAVYRIVSQVYHGTTQLAPASVAYFDPLNRQIRAASQSFDGRWVYKDTVYDNQGRVEKVSRPYFAGAAIHWVTSEYDDLGRVVKVFEPDEPGTAALTVAYNGLTVARTNRKGQTTTETKNSQGQKISVTDAMGNVTAYAYDPFGNLVRTADPAGNEIRNAYDLRGRKTHTSDPDLGLWTYDYNALGELVKQTDAKSQVTTQSYDKLGRMIQRIEPGLTSNWTYDTAANGKGKLHQATTNAGYSRTHAYDAQGRPQSTQFTLGSGNPTLTTGVAYDSTGRAYQQTYPSGLIVKQIYNAYGFVAEVRNGSTNALYWRAEQMDAEGHLIKETAGNGVVTDYGYRADSGRLENITAYAGATQIQGHAYQYDTIGNVTTVADAPGSQLEIRGGYDALNRLTLTDITVNGVTTQQNLTYNAIGNILSKSGVGNYTYGDALHKHAVTAVTGGPANLSYSYDANGNLINGAGRSVTWTAWNMPASITSGGQTQSWTYGPEHDRYKMVAAGRTTWYINPSVHQGGHYEQTLYTSGTTEHRHTLYGGGRAIGEVLTFSGGAASQTRYFHSDQQGSIVAVTNETGVVINRYRYDPWGKQTVALGSNTGIAQTRQGHTGHEMLDNGLTHMNGRLYDPVLSRFVSADPYIQAPDDLQSFNRYTYVMNNPLGNTDPTGYFSIRSFTKSVLKFLVAPTPKNTFESIRNQPGQAQVDRYVMTHKWAYAVGQTAATIGTFYCGGCGGAAFAAYYTYIATGSITAATKTGAITWAASYAFSYVNAPGGLTGIQNIVANGVIGGVSSKLQGGSFADGFKFAALSATFSQIYQEVVGNKVNPKPGIDPEGKDIPGCQGSGCSYNFEDGKVPLTVRQANVNIMGTNELIIGDPSASINFLKQGGTLGRIMNRALPLGNATGLFHDTIFGPRFGWAPYFNSVTNWGTMLPAYAVTWGAFLEGTPSVSFSVSHKPIKEEWR